MLRIATDLSFFLKDPAAGWHILNKAGRKASYNKVGSIQRIKDKRRRGKEERCPTTYVNSPVDSPKGCSRQTAPACLQNSRVAVIELFMLLTPEVFLLKVHSFRSFQISDVIITIMVLMPFMCSGLALLIICTMMSSDLALSFHADG